MSARSGVARLSYGFVTQAHGSVVRRARKTSTLARMLEVVLAAAGAPLFGRVVPVAHGMAAGIRLRGERRSLIWLSGRTEAEVQAVLAKHLPVAGTFFDVGASIGFFSLLAARLVGTEGTVVAFEPQPAAARSIGDNAQLNGFDNVSVVKAAVSSRPGFLTLEGVGTATAWVSPNPGPGAIDVTATTLDSYLFDSSQRIPDFVKIDTEGHEVEVVRGMSRTLAEGRTTLVVECHANVADVVAILEASGLEVSMLGSDAPLTEPSRLAHLLATPRPDLAPRTGL